MALTERPIRLPRLRPYVPKADDPAIFWFNGERPDIVREVERRIVDVHSESRQKLEYALNDIAFHESQRLARQKDDETRESLGYWRGLVRRIARMTDEDKRQTLARIVGGLVEDVAGNFDPRVYKLAETVVPRLITAVMSPSSLPHELLNPSSGLRDLVRLEGSVERLKRLSKKGALVYVPTHSSNLDSVILGYGLQVSGLAPAVYGAGKNLFSNPIISFFMHNLGAYRVDRRIHAQIYKEVLKTYSSVMIERGYHSLFFPGGTRSRSGMIETKLKLGLAGTGVEAFSRNQVRGVNKPVFFVPTTINYALVLEAETLVEDFLKEKGQGQYIIEDDEFSRIERWIAFFRKAVSLTSACIIRFGDPIDPFGNEVDDEGRSLTSQGRTIDPGTYICRRGKPSVDAARDHAYTRELGDVLAARFKRETVITSTQLVAHVMFRRIVRSTPGLDLFMRVRHRGDVSMAREELVREVGDARDALMELETANVVRVSPLIRREPAEIIVERALSAFRGYHSRVAALDVGSEVTAEDPTLLFYYQNRLVPFAERIANESNLAAAREIEQVGRAL